MWSLVQGQDGAVYEWGRRMDRFVNAGSWHVAAEFVRAFPSLRVFHTHPGGGQYDCLTIVGDGLKIDINRAGGSIHIHDSPAGSRSPLIPGPEWQDQLLRRTPPRELAQRIASGCGLDWPKNTPPTRPHVLVYRVIAQFLEATMFDPAGWDATTQFLDSSGMTFPGDQVGVTPHPEMSVLPANKVWMLVANDEARAWLWDGWAWTAGGERRDLYAAYRAGSTTADLAALLTRPRPRHRSPSLLPIPGLPRQPIGEWP